MSLLLFVTLILHIAGGFVGMFSGFLPLLTPKGGREHRRWGRVFTYAMGLTAITALPLAAYRSDLFQAGVGLLAGYLAVFGWRGVLRHKSQTSFPILDSCLAIFSGVVFVLLIGFGLLGSRETARPAVIYGVLGLILVFRDLQSLITRDVSLRRRVTDHILASSLTVIIGVASFLNTQLSRLTGLHWSLEAKMLFPLAVVLPFLVWNLFVWSRRLATAITLANILPPSASAQRPEIPRLRQFAMAEGISFVLLLFVATPIKRFFGEAILVRLLGPVHGALFVLYIVALCLAIPVLRWAKWRIVVAFACAVLPLGTFLVEAWLKRGVNDYPPLPHSRS